MEKVIVDAKGKSCPQPVVMSKKALAELAVGETMVVLVDNEVSKTNVENFLASNNYKVETATENGVSRITAIKTEQISHSEPESPFTEEQGARKHVIAIKSNRMGHGSDELGEILIRAFINTIQEVKPLPEAVIFYNSGIELSLKDSPVLESLQELEALGVEIIVCGTCIDYYKQKENVSVGIISNMFEIMEYLSQAAHIITP